MSNALLTIIIPFLNEKEEVLYTVKSIRENSNAEDIAILLINDSSDDGFDYESISRDYQTEYIFNYKRLGVAASRNLGVEKSETSYVLFLDAHMRFYNDKWVERIIYELGIDERALLCFQTKVLEKKNGKIFETEKRPISYGAYVELYNERIILEPNWIFVKDNYEEDLQTVSIPCVLGAAYACSKKYWLYLKGLEGLMLFGHDEPYISMKVWLEGGMCKLVKDISIGHIYRSNPPYGYDNQTRLYNRLLIAELLLSDYHRSRIYSQISNLYCSKDALLMIYNNRRMIVALKAYYKALFTKEYSFFENMNNKYREFKYPFEKDELLNRIYLYLLLHYNSLQSNGLFMGKLGIVIFFFHYARYRKDSVYTEIAEKLLDEILDELTVEIPLSFNDGLIGVGWAIEYLFQNDFVLGNTSIILSEFDSKIIGIDLDNINDFGLDNGLAGITHYVLSRLYTIERSNNENPFAYSYLRNLYIKIQTVINEEFDGECLDIYIRYSMYFEQLLAIKKPTIYDLVCLIVPNNYKCECFNLGLYGSAGVALKLILDN